MAETLGMLCDKLTIVKLKEYHTQDEARLKSLQGQSSQLEAEINQYVNDAINGIIPLEKLTFAANKVYKKNGNETPDTAPTIGGAFSQLADVNCRLWHEVEKGYDIKSIAADEKDKLINNLAVLNLERNNCIDSIDVFFREIIIQKNK